MSKNTPSELTQEKVHIIVEILEYVPKAVVSKTIIKTSIGNTSVSLATGGELAEKAFLFDSYIRTIDGAAEIIVN